jgi:hypothetical protein
MDLKLFLTLLSIFFVVALAAYVSHKLLVLSQSKEDQEDERLWHYLLFPHLS